MRIPSRDIPQADLLQDVLACARMVSKGATSYQEMAGLLRKTDRQGRYYRRAGEILGLIETVGKNRSHITPFGSKVLALDPEARKVILAKRVSELAIFRMVLKALDNSGGSMDRHDIEELLQFKTRLATREMRQRRLKTIVSWLVYVRLVKESEAGISLRVSPKKDKQQYIHYDPLS